ncbi:MAG: GTPase HflX [Bacteroidales bacterium]|nr:GTPase HflX [Bacteroidales bacterium]
MISTAKIRERAVLVGLATDEVSVEKEQEYIDELAFLAETAETDVVRTFIQKTGFPQGKFYVGSGKLQEIKTFIEDNDIDTVIFDDELSPAQLRNIEGELKRKVLDRTTLILDIFARHARTAHARTQVELAQYQYLLPRLTGLWTHLSKQRGGVGMRGPGEKEIETDRRVIRNKISLLKERLAEIDKQKATQRKHREQLVRVALVGYTNVGKSSLMNLLSKSNVLAENKLFATLDTTVRKVVIKNLPFLLSDTVGFIRKLPHHLVESFKSTLDEVRESDILLHVVDISHPEFEDQMEVVAQTLSELGTAEKRHIVVFNKIDAYTYEEKEPDDLSPVTPRNYSLDDLKKTWMGKAHTPCFFVSAYTKENIPAFREFLYEEIKRIHQTRYPYDKFLYDEYTETGEIDG